MFDRLRCFASTPLNTAKRYAVAAAFHLTVVAGICFLPAALLLSQVGVTVPVGKVIHALHSKYEQVVKATRDHS